MSQSFPFFSESVERAIAIASAIEIWTLPVETPEAQQKVFGLMRAVSGGDPGLAEAEAMDRLTAFMAYQPFLVSLYLVNSLRYSGDAVLTAFLDALRHPEAAQDKAGTECRRAMQARLELLSRIRLVERVFAPARMQWLKNVFPGGNFHVENA